MAEIVPATQQMLGQFDPMPRTVRAIAAVEGERVLGVTGFYPEGGKLVLMASIADDARSEIDRHKRTLVRAARKVMQMAQSLRMPIYAYADPEISGSESLLEHLGFTHTTNRIYTWPGHR
jgi:hypothetical protein